MSSGSPRAASQGGLELQTLPTSRIAKWLLGIRLIAVSALLVGALLVQSVTEEILRSIARETKKRKPYQPKTAESHLKGLQKVCTSVLDLLDERIGAAGAGRGP